MRSSVTRFGTFGMASSDRRGSPRHTHVPAVAPLHVTDPTMPCRSFGSALVTRRRGSPPSGDERVHVRAWLEPIRWPGLRLSNELEEHAMSAASTGSLSPEAMREAIATLSSPSRVESPFGALDFFDGVPTPETVTTIYDGLDLMRG